MGKRDVKTDINFRSSNDWSKDDVKFGQRMLEKMGWKKGQGLGLRNQGMSDNLKLRMKLDSRGLGYKDNDNDFLQLGCSYANLFSELKKNNKTTSCKSIVSLEERSQTSKSRLHYAKFTRSKDLSLYEDKDLTSIFGCSLGGEVDATTDERSTNSNNDNDSKNDDHDAGETKDDGKIDYIDDFDYSLARKRFKRKYDIETEERTEKRRKKKKYKIDYTDDTIVSSNDDRQMTNEENLEYITDATTTITDDRVFNNYESEKSIRKKTLNTNKSKIVDDVNSNNYIESIIKKSKKNVNDLRDRTAEENSIKKSIKKKKNRSETIDNDDDNNGEYRNISDMEYERNADDIDNELRLNNNNNIDNDGVNVVAVKKKKCNNVDRNDKTNIKEELNVNENVQQPNGLIDISKNDNHSNIIIDENDDNNMTKKKCELITTDARAIIEQFELQTTQMLAHYREKLNKSENKSKLLLKLGERGDDLRAKRALLEKIKNKTVTTGFVGTNIENIEGYGLFR